MWPFGAQKDIPTFQVASTVGRGTTVRGDLAGPGGFRIDGTVEGSIDSDGPVVVGEDGVVAKGIRARQLVVLGCVRGDVHADHLEIGPKGKVIGNVSAQSLRMHKGGTFRGSSRMADDAASKVALVALPPAERGAPGRTLPPPADAAVPPPPSASEERLVTRVASARAPMDTKDMISEGPRVLKPPTDIAAAKKTATG
jgi:cytoskeletal protein CcmA (bactofilin family)